MRKGINPDSIPRDYDGLEKLMHERRREIDEELAKLVRRNDSIEETIVSRKTRKGKPLTLRGLHRLLSDLRGIHYRQSIIMMEGESICKDVAIWQDNEFHAAKMAAREAA